MPGRFKMQRPRLQVDHVESAFSGPGGDSRWTNKDLDPIRREDRKWSVFSLIAYWFSDAFNAATWEFAASMLAIGLSYKDAIGIVATGFFTVSIVIALNGAIGVLYHAPFPVLARASWGFWGSYVAIISRVILAMFWFAIQTANGGDVVQVMITAIWPSFATLPNHIPVTQGITTAGMISFLLFWLAQVPFLYMHPNNLRHLFIAKSIIVPICFIAMLIWAFRSTHGTGGILLASTAKATIGGPTYSYAWLSSLTAVIGNYATLSVNMPDFSRYSRASVKWQWLYVPMLPVVFTFISFCGIASTSAALTKYGSLEWNPAALISLWPNRACRFFAGFAFALAALGVNISANSLSAANDLAALFPTYVNIRRGQLLCAVIAWVMVPWKILASAGSFLNFMSAYSVFLGPIGAILVWDFWWVHKRKYDVVALYHRHSIYRYTYGINWRAILAFLVGVAPNMPGFITSVNPKIKVGVGSRPYTFAWLLGFAITSLVYVLASAVFPPRESMIDRAVLPDEVYEGEVGSVTIEGKAVDGEPGDVEGRGGRRPWGKEEGELRVL
ncbi:ncs1 allantoate transporter [Lasallia pustulata]|uniref:Ncs1 allantoate transporter n=1 Tax=Lasallia pustulata TaxID=136370 RepID=A0A1W5D2M5_9LECA|nr:ncs1 allantoate transporter [Lasallia pustulata]